MCPTSLSNIDIYYEPYCTSNRSLVNGGLGCNAGKLNDIRSIVYGFTFIFKKYKINLKIKVALEKTVDFVIILLTIMYGLVKRVSNFNFLISDHKGANFRLFNYETKMVLNSIFLLILRT